MELVAVFSPLFAFVITFLFGKQIGDKGVQFITCFAVILAAFASVILFSDVALRGQDYVTILAPWIVSGDFVVEWALKMDTLSVVMMCVINIVSACVHVYSVGYMSHDPEKGRFMAYLSLFTFAMLMLVTSNNLLQLFFGWEGVGLASYLLIGFWNHKHSANAAAQKAFVVNRVGDFGLSLGIMAIFVLFGSIEFSEIFRAAPDYADATFKFVGFELHAMTLIGLLLFIGAIGKSAQLGLHTWLPDAMEGPTPVSALIHAATMVTAGVFLVARFSPLYEFAPVALMVVTVVGGLTAFVAATIGLTQFDIKRVIAYSTMSQLGYMFFALGVSAYGAAMFHLMTHAFFKALLFLGAGSVIHALSDEQDMRNMGGVWKKIPLTYGAMWIGGLALAGIPPFAGYFSKDIVLEAAWADHTWFGELAYWLGISAAFMTAFYTWRLIIMTFHGKPRASKKIMDHVHESPPSMLIPLAVLASGAILSGFIFYNGFVGSAHHDSEHGAGHEVVQDLGHEPPGVLTNIDDMPVHEFEAPDETLEHVDELKDEEQLALEITSAPYVQRGWNKEEFWAESLFVTPDNDTVEAAHNVPFWVKKLPLLMGLLGIGLAYLFYMFRPSWPDKVKSTFSWVHNLMFNKWYFDELYDFLFVRTSKALGQFFWYQGDQRTIDRFGPDGSANASNKVAQFCSKFQTGFVFQYAFIMMLAVIGLVSWFFFKSGQGF